MKFLTSTQTRNARAFKLTSIGLTLLMISAIGLITNPVQKIIDWQLSLKPGTLFHLLWLKPPIDMYISIMIFNITNAAEFLSGADKRLKVVEVGPYVYQEFLENTEVQLNENNSTLTYVPRRWVEFVPDRSKGDPKVDRIIAANLPYLGITSVASSFSYFAGFALSTLARHMNTTTIIDKTVDEYLWGYDDPLVTLANKLLPSIFDFKRFGVMERILDERRNVVNINIPESVTPKQNRDQLITTEKEDSARGFSVANWNGSPGLKHWNYRENGNKSHCNMVQGVYDGTLFPRDMRRGETFRLYRKAFCRTMPIQYSHDTTINGVEGYVFKLKEDAFDTRLGDPETGCLCKSGKCLKRGLSSVSPCYYNMPLAISYPHFYNADPSLLESVEGLAPNEALHGSEVIVQPQLGIPMRVHTRFQVNMLVGDIQQDSELKRVSNLVIPVFWTTIGIDDLRPSVQWLLIAVMTLIPYGQVFVILMIVLYGIWQIVKALKLYFWTRDEVWKQLMIIPPRTATTATVESANAAAQNMPNAAATQSPHNKLKSPLYLFAFWRTKRCSTPPPNNTPSAGNNGTTTPARVMDTRLQLLRQGVALPGKEEADVLLP